MFSQRHNNLPDLPGIYLRCQSVFNCNYILSGCISKPGTNSFIIIDTLCNPAAAMYKQKHLFILNIMFLFFTLTKTFFSWKENTNRDCMTPVIYFLIYFFIKKSSSDPIVLNPPYDEMLLLPHHQKTELSKSSSLSD